MKSLPFSFSLLIGLFALLFPSVVFSQVNTGLNFTFNKEQLKINGITMDSVRRLQPVMKILGKENRITTNLDGSETYVYDAEGLSFDYEITERRNYNKITGFLFHFEPDTSITPENWPYGIYQGRLSIDGMRIDSNTTPKMLIKGLKEYEVKRSIEHIYIGRSGKMAIVFEKDPVLNKIRWLSIQGPSGYIDYR